ncbi:MAG TPA: hypothetical protein VNS63_22040 [Blastocatellia bacterium]|nr:hypothetical protein [Blastocatellia bacterium]
MLAAKKLTHMDAQLAETTIKTYLNEIRSRLDRAAGISRAADACASAGFHEKGLEVALDMEQLLYEATTLLKATRFHHPSRRHSYDVAMRLARAGELVRALADAVFSNRGDHVCIHLQCLRHTVSAE